MLWECSKRHKWLAKANSIQQGCWCPYCAGKAPKSLEYCQELAKLKNGECLSIKFKNVITKMKWGCQEGHQWEARAGDIQQGHWCPYCAGLAPKDLEYCQELASKKNGKCLSTKYNNILAKMEWECQEDHRWEAVVNNIRQGKWCPYCAGKISKTLEYCQNLASKRGGRCLSTEYKNNHTKMDWECQEGHRWEAKANDIQQGHWCPHCHPQYSKAEKELFEFIKEKYPDAEPNKKGLLKTKKFELDIYVPSLKVGIEYDGEYWHTLEKAKKRDSHKNKQCVDSGIRLIRIKEEDYLRIPLEVKKKLLEQLIENKRNS